MVAPASGRAMELYTNQPGVQFYTGALQLLHGHDRSMLLTCSLPSEGGYTHPAYNPCWGLPDVTTLSC